MKDYVEQQLWRSLEITKPYTMWVAQHLLNIPPELIIRHRSDLSSLIYRVFFSLESHENKYITAYNGSRADLVASLITPTDDDERIIRIDSEPMEDTSYWICSHVLGFADIEISVLCNVDVGVLQDPGMELIPLVKSAYKTLQKIKLNDPLMQHFHKSRHVMIRYFLDAEYHEL